jgi:hypothetical protein
MKHMEDMEDCDIIEDTKFSVSAAFTMIFFR